MSEELKPLPAFTPDAIQRAEKTGADWAARLKAQPEPAAPAGKSTHMCWTTAAKELNAAPSVAPEPPDVLCWACGIAINTSQPLPVAPEPVATVLRKGGASFEVHHTAEQAQRLTALPCGHHLLYLAAHPPRAPLTREALAEIVRSHLTSTYHCTRVWEAWHVGTMTEDIADAILANHPPRAPLTDAEVDDLSREMVKGGKSVNWLCRAIEQAHGIGAAK